MLWPDTPGVARGKQNIESAISLLGIHIADVIPGADGARKVRWSRAGSGKSGGAWVTDFNLTEQEVVMLVAAYAKADRDNMLTADIEKVV